MECCQTCFYSQVLASQYTEIFMAIVQMKQKNNNHIHITEIFQHTCKKGIWEVQTSEITKYLEEPNLSKHLINQLFELPSYLNNIPVANEMMGGGKL